MPCDIRPAIIAVARVSFEPWRLMFFPLLRRRISRRYNHLSDLDEILQAASHPDVIMHQRKFWWPSLKGLGVAPWRGQILLCCLYIRRRPYKHLTTTVVSVDRGIIKKKTFRRTYSPRACRHAAWAKQIRNNWPKDTISCIQEKQVLTGKGHNVRVAHVLGDICPRRGQMSGHQCEAGCTPARQPKHVKS